jgi:hypothetical protein
MDLAFAALAATMGPKLDARRRALRRSAPLGAPSSAQAVIRKEKNA